MGQTEKRLKMWPKQTGILTVMACVHPLSDSQISAGHGPSFFAVCGTRQIGLCGLEPGQKKFTMWLCTSGSNLLLRSLHQLVIANILSANHLAATKCLKACRHGLAVSCCSEQISEWGRNVIKVALTMEWLFVSDRVVSVSQNLLISCVSKICREWCEKTSSEQQFCGKKCVVN